MLSRNSQLKVNQSIENIKKITEKCVSFGVKKIYVSGLVFTRMVDLPTLERVHALLSNFCGDNGFVYIHNRNIKGDCLYQDSLHLLETGQKILERNFIFVLNERFLEINTYHPPVNILVKESNTGLISSGFEVVKENRVKYLNNPLIGYLNINSLRNNKIVDLREIILEFSLDYLVLSAKKIDESFPTAHFYIKGYEVRARRDRDKHGGGLIKFVKNGFISKRLKEYETKQSESSLLLQTGNGYA